MLERAANAAVEVVEIGRLNPLSIRGVEDHQTGLHPTGRFQVEEVGHLHADQVLQTGGADALPGIAHGVLGVPAP